jgi:hypothetical protein
MSCIISGGYALDCKESVGGIKAVYIAGFSSIVYDIPTGGVIAGVDAGDFYEFELPPQTGNFTTTANTSIENQSTFYQTELVIQLPKLSTTARNQFMVLTKGRFAIIVLDRLGNKHVLGYENGCFATTGTASSGTAMGDLNGQNLTFTSIEVEAPYMFSGSVPLA